MRKTNLFSAVLSLFLLVPASITRAQKITQEKGLTTAEFNLPQGKIKIFLPDEIPQGDQISGRVVTEPVGKNAKQIENNLTELKKYAISLNNEKFAVDANKPFQFLVQSGRPMTGTIGLINISGVIKEQLTIPAVPGKEQQPSAAQCIIPSHTLTGSPLRITGPFDGNSSNTHCSLGNKPMEILAESPGQCIVSFPGDGQGLQRLNVQETGKQLCTQQVSGVQMNVSAGKLNLRKGENTYIDVNITGLQNLPDTAFLTLINMTTAVVIMQPSNTVVIPILPDTIGSGTFNRRFDIQSTRTGSFSVNVKLDLPGDQPIIQREPDPPPFHFDQKPLDKPRRLESKALQIGLHVGIKKLVADAGGARGQEWNTVCDNCRQCIEARMGTWAADLVKELGEGIIKEFAGKAVDLIGKGMKGLGAAKEFFDKVSENLDNAEKLAKDIEDKIRAGELQIMDFKPEFCKKSTACLISGTIFYNPTTGCVFAVIYCQGRADCCPVLETIVTMTYCTDENGMPTSVPDIGVIKS